MGVSAHTLEVQVAAALNGILDPCSVASTVPIGLADMGLVKEIAIDDGHVSVILMTTAPHCMYVGHFTTQVEERLKELPWVTGVEVTIAYGAEWDEARMAPGARERLAARFGRRRRAA